MTESRSFRPDLSFVVVPVGEKEIVAYLQTAEFDAYFEVTGGGSGNRYRIHDCAAINVHQLDRSSKIVRKWCLTPEGSLASGDVLLAQKIALELFEKDALSVAKPYLAN